MKRLFILLFAAALIPLWAADPPGFSHWTGKALKDYGKTLAPKMNAQKVATENLANYGNHTFMVAYREGSGEAELHENQADFFIVQSGQAILMVGGTVVGGRTTAPGEIRGASISGGEKKQLSVGDIVHIPVRVPHQVLLEGNGQFTYAVIKVDSK
jgi:mannose-6-phosphate isomerase-like protein (cupin superfamily)